MPALVAIGAQWGDEGKGKIVDLYAKYADVVARYGGGANAGHTLVVKGSKVVCHLVPPGALHPHITSILGQGMVIDPRLLVNEIEELTGRHGFERERIRIADRSH